MSVGWNMIFKLIKVNLVILILPNLFKNHCVSHLNKLAKLRDAIAISNLKLSMTQSPTDKGWC